MQVLKHVHKRKHLSKSRSSKSLKALDFITYIAAIVGPAITFHQIYLIFSLEDASSISVLTWLVYTALSFVWVFYGYAHKDKPIFLTNIFWILANGLVLLGAYIYGGNFV